MARRAATSGRWSTAVEGGSGELAVESPRRDRDVAEHGNRDGVEAPEGVGFGVHLHDRLVRRDPRVVRERRAEHQEQVGFVHDPRGDGRSAAAEHTARERVIVGHDALGLEGGDDRRVQALGERDDVVDAGARAVPDDDHRAAARRASNATARSTAPSGGAIAVSARRPLGEPDRARVAGRERLYLVGQHEVGDTALHERVLAREAHQLAVVGVALHRLRVERDVGERGGEIEVLERAAPAHLRRNLARDREHRSAVDLGVVEAGEQVGRARARRSRSTRRAGR